MLMENVNRMYSKTELGLLYFPDATDKDTARRHIMVWIKRCKPLWRELEGMGYDANAKYLPPKMVNAIFEYLGEPGC